MEEMDFERRRELRRQKREEMRLEAERMARNEDDEEEAARERRRRARQERLISREMEEPSGQTDSVVTANSHSVTETASRSYGGGAGDDEDQALLDRMAKREERRQRRLQEALERQRQQEAEGGESLAAEKDDAEEDRPSSRRRARYRDGEEAEEKTEMHGTRREEKGQEEAREEEEAAPGGGAEEEEEEEEEQKVEAVEDGLRRSYLRDQVSHLFLGPVLLPLRRAIRGVAGATSPGQEPRVRREKCFQVSNGNSGAFRVDTGRTRAVAVAGKRQNAPWRRNDVRHVFCNTCSQEEKRKMKEEIERRRAEAAEKRQKVEDNVDGEDRPFKCVSPRGSSLKIGERAEFLNKSAQKSAVKTTHSPVVSKIDNRLEQYTSAAQRENKESRSPRSGAVDLPVVADSIRNIKSMWEKGNVFSSPGGGGGQFKEAAAMKTGVAGRINEWLNKTPESGKTSGGRPSDLKPVDVTNKRSLWENKGGSPTKVAGRAETKSVANGMGH
eukprot:XP_011616852.1 PREDICTED: non-muscle caldesmon-like [Takifugu rubripes]